MKYENIVVILVICFLTIGLVSPVISSNVRASDESVAKDESLKPELVDHRSIGETTNIHIYDYNCNYSMDYDVPPEDIKINLDGDIIDPSNKTTQSFTIDVRRPDGRTLEGLISDQVSSADAETFDKRYYIGRNLDVRDQIYNWAKPFAEGEDGIVVKSLRVSPSIITPGSSVQITAKLNNFGTEEDSVNLTIDGEKIKEYTVKGEGMKILSPLGDEMDPALAPTFNEMGTHEIKLGDESWTVSVVNQSQMQTDIKVTNLEKNFYSNVGDEVTIKFNANNTGDEAVEESVYVSGRKVHNFTVPANTKIENETATFSVGNKQGTLPVKVGDQNAYVLVQEKGLPTPQEIDPAKVLFSKANEHIFSTDPDPLKGEYNVNITVTGDKMELNYGEDQTSVEIVGAESESSFLSEYWWIMLAVIIGAVAVIALVYKKKSRPTEQQYRQREPMEYEQNRYEGPPPQNQEKYQKTDDQRKEDESIDREVPPPNEEYESSNQ